MQLYSGPLSLFTAKVRIALDEKGIAYDRIDVPFGREQGYEPKHPQVLVHNPKQQVPVLVDGDLVLWDSTVILEYLEDRHPEPRLMPVDPIGRARCRMLELQADEVFFPNVWTLIRETFYGGQSESEEISEARSEIQRHYADFDKMLADRDWIGGRDMTTADLTVRLIALFASSLGSSPHEGLPHWTAWMTRIDARPSVAKELAGLVQAVGDLSRPD